MKLHKKGSDQLMAWGLLLIMAVVVVTSAVYVGAKTRPFTSKMGEVQSEMVKNYHNGELALIFTDQAAKYSMDNSIPHILEKAGFMNEPPCGYDSFLDDQKDYVLWQKVDEAIIGSDELKEKKCYPKKKDIRKSIATSFNKEFNEYAEKYTPTIIPKNNYDLVLEEKEDKIEITGIATQKIRFPPDREEYKQKVFPRLSKELKECLEKESHYLFYHLLKYVAASPPPTCRECSEKTTCRSYNSGDVCIIDPCNIGCRWDDKKCKKANSIYAVTPSFKTEINYNFLGKFKEYEEKAEEIQKNIRGCLAIGGTDNNPEDILSCTENKKLHSEIKDIEDYEISGFPPGDDQKLPGYDHISIPSKKYYTILFRIKEQSPYSNEEIVTKFAIELLDDIPPPATKIMTDQNDWPLNYQGSLYLKWEPNPASDILAYWIYYKKIEKTLDGNEIPSSPPTDISTMDNFVGRKTYESNVIGITPVNQDPFASADVIWAPYTEWKIDSSLEGDYYFIIVAQDKFSNKAVELEPKRMYIPTKGEIEESQQQEATDLSDLFTI